MSKDKKNSIKNILNNKRQVKGKALTAWIIVIIIVAMVVTFGSGLIFGKLLFEEKKDNTSKDETNTSTDTDDDSKIIDEVINIAGANTTSSFYLDVALLEHDGVIEEFDKETKTIIVYSYASRNGFFSSVSNSHCEATGKCIGIKKSDFNEIAKKYGLTEFVPQIYGHDCYEYNNMYLFDFGGDIQTYEKIEHNYSYNIVDTELLLTDDATYIAAANSEEENKTVVREFLFKKNDVDNYYLYSVYAK